MKPVLLLVSLLILTLPSIGQDCGCTYKIQPSESGRAYSGNENLESPWTYPEDVHFEPGSVICIMAGVHAKFLDFYNLIGTEEKPITIINCGGQAVIMPDGNQDGMDIWGSENLIVTGTGDPDIFYGIKVVGGQNGVRINHSSRNYELDHLELIDNGAHGLDLKNDPDCNDKKTWRSGNWPIEWVSVHDNHVSGTKDEGFYIGNSHYDKTVSRTCNDGTRETFEEADLIDVEVYNNIVENVGWDGIQVGSVIGEARIYDNQVYNYGTSNNEFHQAGYQINPGTKAVMWNNLALNGTGSAFHINGDGVKMFNNVSYNSKTGVSAYRKKTSDDATYEIYNNTFLNTTFAGIGVLPESYTIPNNLFINNIVHWVETAEYGAYQYKDTYAWLDENNTNNIYTDDISSLGFVDLDGNDFRLTKESIAVDGGSCIDLENFNLDYEGFARKFGDACDVGAYEYSVPSIHTDTETLDLGYYFLNVEVISVKSYLLKGSNIRDEIKIVIPDHFQVSLDSLLFDDQQDTLVISYVDQHEGEHKVFVKFVPENAVDVEFEEELVHLSGGEIKSIKLLGEQVVLGTAVNLENEVVIYPNPLDSNGIVKIDFKGLKGELVRIELIDMLGKLVFKESVSFEKVITLNVDSVLSNGMYVLQIKVDDQENILERLYINR